MAEEGTCTALEGPADLVIQARKDIAEIKDYLSDSLPSYMVPAAWIVLTRMPVVVSGKLDRKRVSTWVESLDEDAYETIARNLGLIEEDEEDVQVSGTAKMLKEIWAKELQVPMEKIKSNKAVLSLGGDSIRAMGVVSRARTAGLGLNIQDVLRSKSVVHLAQVARFLAPTTNESRNGEESSEPFALSPVQRMYMQLADSYQGDARFNQSNILGVARRVGVSSVRRAMDSVVQRHAMLRARFNKSQDGNWDQHVTRVSVHRCLE
jgi:aryl carrier-like protein